MTPRSRAVLAVIAVATVVGSLSAVLYLTVRRGGPDTRAIPPGPGWYCFQAERIGWCHRAEADCRDELAQTVPAPGNACSPRATAFCLTWSPPSRDQRPAYACRPSRAGCVAFRDLIRREAPLNARNASACGEVP